MFTNLQIYPINTKELMDKVLEVADNDGRRPLYPTHVILKDGEIAGAFCTCSPTVYWWMHSEKITNRDSYKVFQSLDTLMNENNTSSYILPCHPESSYYPLLTSRVGRGLTEYKGDGGDDWTLFLKE
tara:strand:- start:285 stop:665 length:381 start_codon:yes stop_codon:yes gene_type:complete